MIKRLIFDFDDTLIPFKKEYYDILFSFYKKYLPKENTVEAFVGLMDYLEENIDYYTKDVFISIIEDYLNITLPDNFWDDFVKLMIDMVDEDDSKIKPLLEYLSSKYELVILTNWIKDVQVGKLKKLGLDSYFKDVYACDTYLVKPSEESFNMARGPYSYEECAMIGDSFKIDIEKANELGMKTYFLTSDNISLDNNICISSIYELKELL